MVANRKMMKRRGQGMTEYILIVALIAIAAIGIITLFGDNIRRIFGASSDALNGTQTAVGNKDANAAMRDKNITNFNQNNSAP